MKARKIFLLTVFSSIFVLSYSQQTTLLEVQDKRNVTTEDVPYSHGATIQAQLKPARSVNIDNPYLGINLSISPHWQGGWGYNYQLNFNSDGLYFRSSTGSTWLQWSKVIMTNWWDQSVNFNGNVIVGTANSSKRLDVYGIVSAREVLIETKGADFVFEEGYNLKSLDEVKAHIEEYKHLPDVPSAAHMQENGVGVSELSTKLLQKVEELTLYVIRQNETIEKLNNRINELESSQK